MEHAKKWLTVKGIADYCMVDRITVRRWIKGGKLSATRLPSSHYRITVVDFRDWLLESKSEKKEGTEGIPDLEAKLLAAITEHPQGITLTEVAESLGVVPIVFGRAAKKLVDEGRVRKEDKTYFPIARE